MNEMRLSEAIDDARADTRQGIGDLAVALQGMWNAFETQEHATAHFRSMLSTLANSFSRQIELTKRTGYERVCRDFRNDIIKQFVAIEEISQYIETPIYRQWIRDAFALSDEEFNKIADIVQGQQEPIVQEPSPIQIALRQRRSETKRVEYHLKRAETVGLPATLTLKQWLATLEYFEWKCAYCPTGTYEVFEHYTPIIHGGGTTVYNCVPACNRCNVIKTDLHPFVFEAKFPKDARERIKEYLHKQREALL
jgi:5-methylcytosine-specific restriction endonuclease McrA